VTARRLAIGPDAIDLQELVRVVCAEDPGANGAIVTFAGTVRGENKGRRVTRLEYEAYEPLALRAFAMISDEVKEHWPAARVAIHHRTGSLAVGETSVAIATASPHRAEAFSACRYVIERLKQVAPIWKHEFFEEGEAWIEGATADPHDASAREEAYRRSCV
jgi:molybdopterin synthase catalytic subunit